MHTFVKSFLKGLFIVLIFSGITTMQVHAAPRDVSRLRISLITCGPGNDLYTTFGHTAVRVIDSSNGEDYVFNYGTFDFSTPHFYWKFTRGRLMYFLAVQNFPDFMQEYEEEHRKVTEQVLNLTEAEKQEIWQFLKNNYLPQNRYYKYNFLFDNCSTRIRDIFSRIFGPGWNIEDIISTPGLTFREVINQYLKNHPWEKLGINLTFGKSADDEMTNRQAMFLPDFLSKGVGHSSINDKPLVKKTKTLLPISSLNQTSYPFYKYPLFGFTLLSLLIILLSFSKPTSFSKAVLPWVDRCLFFLTGLLGCFLLFMWFGTDHDICKWNYNLLWAFPPNLIFSFFFYKNTKAVRRYATLVLLLNLFLLVGWFVLPQQLPLTVLPVMVMIAVRCRGILTRNKLSFR